MKTYKKLIAESSLSRLWNKAKNHDFGTITAFRGARDCGQGEAYTKNENMKRNSSLKAKLLAKGYSVTPIDGSYIENYGSKNAKEVREKSFFVADDKNKGTLKTDLLALGLEFEQDSIIFGKAGSEGVLYGTNKCPDAYPGYGKQVKQGGAIFGKDGEFLSRVRGRPFVFKEEVGDEETLPKYPTEIRSVIERSKLHWEDLT